MKYSVIKMDLFKMPEDYVLGHCISSDFCLGGGIAVEFVKRFDARERLKTWYSKYNFKVIGPSTLLIHREGEPMIANIVSKEVVWDKPTYDDFTTAVESFRDKVLQLRGTSLDRFSHKIAIPKIGCGIDGLDWLKVEDIIKDIFKDTDLEIVVCDPFMKGE